jgi:hypothetical protein
MAKAIPNIASVSPFHNTPLADLADELGALKAEIAGLAAREQTLRDELLRRGVAGAEGALFCATISKAVRWTLDAKAVQAEMGAAWWDRRCRQSLVTTVTVKPCGSIAKLAA